jgi:hypothetical protein
MLRAVEEKKTRQAAPISRGEATGRKDPARLTVSMTTSCCAECGKEEGDGGVSLKACKSCMQVRYCNAACQHKNWPAHKIACKLRAAELRDEALFKDPPAKEDCPICFLPDAAAIDKLCLSPTRDYFVSAYLRFRDCK